jgi:hypothetical protein
MALIIKVEKVYKINNFELGFDPSENSNLIECTCKLLLGNTKHMQTIGELVLNNNKLTLSNLVKAHSKYLHNNKSSGDDDDDEENEEQHLFYSKLNENSIIHELKGSETLNKTDQIKIKLYKIKRIRGLK